MDPSAVVDLAVAGDIERGITAGDDGAASSAGITIPNEGAAAPAGKKVKPKRKVFPKPPKPPRPPTPPCLDAADRRLIRELSEIATVKRARIERMKASRKMKNSWPSSSPNFSSICALFVTVIFCIVIVWEAAAG